MQQRKKISPRLGEDIAKHLSGKTLISKIYKELLHINKKNAENIFFLKKAKIRNFTKEGIQIANGQHLNVLNIISY